MSRGAAISLSKHHATGNDFLVFMDLAGRRPVTADEAGALCDRRRGVGADGIVRVLRSGSDADLVMDLRNADGTVAEMSGNGIRCLVQAAVAGGEVQPGTVTVLTPAGLRRVDYEERTPGLGYGRVSMGSATLGEVLTFGDLPMVRSARSVRMGNPHIVLLCDAAAGGVTDDLVDEVGERLSHSVPEGSNVEFVSPGPRRDRLVIKVYERGVGRTAACGTGACASVAAMHDWGLVGDDVEVLFPGGSLEVHMHEDELVLCGPTRKVADVTVLEPDLAMLVVERASGPSDAVAFDAGEMAGRL